MTREERVTYEHRVQQIRQVRGILREVHTRLKQVPVARPQPDFVDGVLLACEQQAACMIDLLSEALIHLTGELKEKDDE